MLRNLQTISRLMFPDWKILCLPKVKHSWKVVKILKSITIYSANVGKNWYKMKDTFTSNVLSSLKEKLMFFGHTMKCKISLFSMINTSNSTHHSFGAQSKHFKKIVTICKNFKLVSTNVIPNLSQCNTYFKTLTILTCRYFHAVPVVV